MRRPVVLSIVGITACIAGSSPRAKAAPVDRPGLSDERIVAFDSAVQVRDDGALAVEETIQVQSAGKEFRHGLERIFPVRYAGALGGSAVVGFEVLRADLDGQPEPFFTRRSGRNVVVRIGDPGRLLPPGEHRYRLAYVTTWQLGFFGDHDELYWNAVGTDWRVPVDAATCSVTLPPAGHGRVVATKAYVGTAGSREPALRAEMTPTGASFDAGRPLRVGEGMTTVVAWPKGVVRSPTAGRRVNRWLLDNSDCLAAFLGAVAMALVLRRTRRRLGGASRLASREPSVADQSSKTASGPPISISPVLLRYVVNGGYDPRSLPVAMADMAERGYLTVAREGAHFRLDRAVGELEKLPPEEQGAARALFEAGNHVELAPVDNARLKAAAVALRWDLDQVGESYVAKGGQAAMLLVGLSLAIVVAVLGLSMGQWGRAVAQGIWFGIWSIALFAILGRLISIATNGGAPATKPSTAIVLSLVALPVFAVFFNAADDLAARLSPLAVTLLAVILAFGAAGLWLFRIRTSAGYQLLAAARRVRRSFRSQSASNDPEGFRSWLPYALALDAVSVWERNLARLIRGRPDFTAPTFYDPDWRRDWLNGNNSVASFADAFSRQVINNVPAPGSHSGFDSSGGSSSFSSGSSSSSSDSGGSSGGGGGGGGGGGW